MKNENEFYADANLVTKFKGNYEAYKASYKSVGSVVVTDEQWKGARSLRAQFLSETPFEAGTLTPIKQSEVKSTGAGNEGQVMITCTHTAVKGRVRMSLYEFKTACETAGVEGRDGNGNLLAVTASNIDGKFQVIA